MLHIANLSYAESTFICRFLSLFASTLLSMKNIDFLHWLKICNDKLRSFRFQQKIVISLLTQFNLLLPGLSIHQCLGHKTLFFNYRNLVIMYLPLVSLLLELVLLRGSSSGNESSFSYLPMEARTAQKCFTKKRSARRRRSALASG